MSKLIWYETFDSFRNDNYHFNANMLNYLWIRLRYLLSHVSVEFGNCSSDMSSCQSNAYDRNECWMFNLIHFTFELKSILKLVSTTFNFYHWNRTTRKIIITHCTRNAEMKRERKKTLSKWEELLHKHTNYYIHNKVNTEEQRAKEKAIFFKIIIWI